MAKKEQYYRIDFVNWSEDYGYTIVRNLNEVMPYLELAQPDLDSEPPKGYAATSVTITGVKMTERQYENVLKTFDI